MVFTKSLREGVRRGEITCSVRIWIRPRVRVGARYRMDEGQIEIDSVEAIDQQTGKTEETGLTRQPIPLSPFAT